MMWYEVTFMAVDSIAHALTTENVSFALRFGAFIEFCPDNDLVVATTAVTAEVHSTVFPRLASLVTICLRGGSVVTSYSEQLRTGIGGWIRGWVG